MPAPRRGAVPAAYDIIAGLRRTRGMNHSINIQS